MTSFCGPMSRQMLLHLTPTPPLVHNLHPHTPEAPAIHTAHSQTEGVHNTIQVLPVTVVWKPYKEQSRGTVPIRGNCSTLAQSPGIASVDFLSGVRTKVKVQEVVGEVSQGEVVDRQWGEGRERGGLVVCADSLVTPSELAPS